MNLNMDQDLFVGQRVKGSVLDAVFQFDAAASSLHRAWAPCKDGSVLYFQQDRNSAGNGPRHWVIGGEYPTNIWKMVMGLSQQYTSHFGRDGLYLNTPLFYYHFFFQLYP